MENAVPFAIQGMGGQQALLNPYEEAVMLVEDLDLSRNTYRPRLKDVPAAEQVSNEHHGARNLVLVAGDGRIRSHATAKYGFVWNKRAYFLLGSNNWLEVKEDGTTQTLASQPAPTIQSLQAFQDTLSLSSPNTQWSPVPDVYEQQTNRYVLEWNLPTDLNPQVRTVTYTFTGSPLPNWSGYNSLLVPFLQVDGILNPDDNLIQCQITDTNGQTICRLVKYKKKSVETYQTPSETNLTRVLYEEVEFDLSSAPRSSVSQVAFRVLLHGGTYGSTNLVVNPTFNDPVDSAHGWNVSGSFNRSKGGYKDRARSFEVTGTNTTLTSNSIPVSDKDVLYLGYAFRGSKTISSSAQLTVQMIAYDTNNNQLGTPVNIT